MALRKLRMGHKVTANYNDQAKLSRDTHNADLYFTYIFIYVD